MSPVMNILYLFGTVCLLRVSGEWVFKKNAVEEFEKKFGSTTSALSNSSCKTGSFGSAYADIDNDCKTFRICLPDEKGKLVEYRYSCSNGTVFNEESKVCVHENEYNCNERKAIIKHNKLKRMRRGLFPPSYSYHNLPTTNFTCLGKVLGGYYADPQTDCQMFHICTPGENNSVIDIMFLCGNSTVFDQRKLVCERYGLVDCEDATSYLDEEQRRLKELKEDAEHRKLAEIEISRIRSK